MFDKERFGKILVPLVTSYAESDQALDYQATVEIAKILVRTKRADSIIVAGTTGEFFTMMHEERVKLLETVHQELSGQIPLIAGVGAASTAESMQLARIARDIGYEMAMVVSPYYTKPTQRELYEHFAAVAGVTDMSLLLYNIPIFTGVNVDPRTVEELSRISNIVGIKEEAELNAKQVTEFVNVTPEDFIIYCGDDTMIIESFAQGGGKRVGGVVSGGSHLIGVEIRAMIDTFLAGNVAEAAAEQQRILPLFRIMGQNGRTNPVALLKEAMKMIGYPAGIPRQPLLPGTPEETNAVKAVMEKIGVTEITSAA